MHSYTVKSGKTATTYLERVTQNRLEDALERPWKLGLCAMLKKSREKIRLLIKVMTAEGSRKNTIYLSIESICTSNVFMRDILAPTMHTSPKRNHFVQPKNWIFKLFWKNWLEL